MWGSVTSWVGLLDLELVWLVILQFFEKTKISGQSSVLVGWTPLAFPAVCCGTPHCVDSSLDITDWCRLIQESLSRCTNEACYSARLPGVVHDGDNTTGCCSSWTLALIGQFLNDWAWFHVLKKIASLFTVKIAAHLICSLHFLGKAAWKSSHKPPALRQIDWFRKVQNGKESCFAKPKKHKMPGWDTNIKGYKLKKEACTEEQIQSSQWKNDMCQCLFWDSFPQSCETRLVKFDLIFFFFFFFFFLISRRNHAFAVFKSVFPI